MFYTNFWLTWTEILETLRLFSKLWAHTPLHVLLTQDLPTQISLCVFVYDIYTVLKTETYKHLVEVGMENVLILTIFFSAGENLFTSHSVSGSCKSQHLNAVVGVFFQAIKL